MKNRYLIHPILFALYPIVLFFSENIHHVGVSRAAFLTGLATGLSFLILLAGKLILKDDESAAIATSGFLCFFFFYGYAHEGLTYITSTPHEYFLPLWALMFFFLTYFALAGGSRKRKITTSFLNLVSATLIIITLINIGPHFVGAARRPEINIQNWKESQLDSVQLESPSEPRDIYYIVLDSYPSHSTLEEVYNFDNSEFMDFLEERGFYISAESKSNYSQTSLHFASTLNMNYLDRIKETMGLESNEQLSPAKLSEENLTTNLLKEAGYKLVNFNTWWNDICWGGKKGGECGYLDLCEHTGVNEFRARLIETTAIFPFHPYLPFVPGGPERREDVLCIFSELTKIPDIDQPTFTFAHILPPHPPYLFDADGDPVPGADLRATRGWDNREDYLNQLRFLNRQLKEILKKLLANSSPDPIIVVQADHGPASRIILSNQGGWENPTERMIKERMSILNAFYLPEKKDNLYKSISPINTFRLIFQSFFNAEYELLEDRHYFSCYGQTYDFREVTSLLADDP